MYYGTINSDDLFTYLRNLKCGYILSYDGIQADIDKTVSVPTDLYNYHLYSPKTNSSFSKVIGQHTQREVQESIYIKRSGIVDFESLHDNDIYSKYTNNKLF